MARKKGQRRRYAHDVDQAAPNFVTIPIVVERTKLGDKQIRRAVERGELRSYKIGSWTRLLWSDVIAWVECHRRQPARKTARKTATAAPRVAAGAR
jgi:excisionase family DNA binding protein